MHRTDGTATETHETHETLARTPRPVVGLRGFAVAVAVSAALHAQQAADRNPVLREVRVSTRDVFDDDEAASNLLYRLANTFHSTTRETVVRTEVWFQPGRPIDLDHVAELERNLRAMNLFGETKAVLIDNADGTADVEVMTRDRFSLSISGGGGSVGGVTKYNTVVGERNLFGTGKGLHFTASGEGDDDSQQLRYVDPQLFGSWYEAIVTVGHATEGPFGELAVWRPFKHLEDPFSYGVDASALSREVDYFEAGDTVASVPEDRQEVGVWALQAFGPRELRLRYGPDLRWRNSHYEDPTGPNPDGIVAPGATSEVQVGVNAGIDWTECFLIEEQLDALDYQEDIRLGVFAQLRGALAFRDEEGVGSATQPLLEFDLRAATRPVPETYVTAQWVGAIRTEDATQVSRRSRVALHAFQKSLPYQTLAASAQYEQVFASQELPPQLTLGEESGLRGYPARAVTGDSYLLVNLEDRVMTGLEVLSVHVGLAAFCDIGWIDDPARDVSVSHPLRSVGVGLRLGSSEFLGSGVFRIDLAWTLDDIDGEDQGVSLSMAGGQVFGFFGNARELADEFAGFVR